MSTNKGYMHTGTVAIEYDQDPVSGITTASARPLSEDERRQYFPNTIRLIPADRDPAEGIVGTGIARCRKEDHFVPEIGLELAAARATKDFAEQLERKTVALVETKDEHKVHVEMSEIADLLDELAGAIVRVAETVTKR